MILKTSKNSLIKTLNALKKIFIGTCFLEITIDLSYKEYYLLTETPVSTEPQNVVIWTLKRRQNVKTTSL